MQQIPTLAQVNKAIAEAEYYDFLLQAWPVVEPTTPLENNWHIKYLCDILQYEIERIAKGQPKDKDIIINIPPRSLKSTITTVMLNAWAWARWPHLKFIGASYGGDLAVELSTKTRRLLESDWYRRNWGDMVKFADDQNQKARYENTAGGVRKSVGVGSGLTGSGADCILIDDPLSPLDANSQAARDEHITWFKETAYSRLNDQTRGLRVVIMQRLHEEDLTGWLLRNQPDKWRHICLPATDEYPIAPEEVRANYKDGLFFPSRFSRPVLTDAKTTMGIYGYSGQMGQSPVPAGGGIFKRDWFKRYRELPGKIHGYIWSWDTAGKTGEENDYSVGGLWALHDTGYYLVKVIRQRLEYPDLRRAVEDEFNAHRTNAVLVEDKSSGQAVLQDLKRSTDLPIIGRMTKGDKHATQDKVTRAHLASPTVEAGKVHIPEAAPWVADYISELTMFPNGAHDDQVDMTTQFINWITNRVPLVNSIRAGGKTQTADI